MIRRITPEEEYNAGLVIFRQGGVHPLEDENGFLRYAVDGDPRRIVRVGCYEDGDYMSYDEAGQLTNAAIAEELALPPVKIHCSILAEDAIKAAINDYRNKQSKE